MPKQSRKPVGKSKTPKKRVLIALSGGIDSAVSAWKLLQQGYEVEAAFMKNWSSTNGLKYDECPWLQDRQDALRVAAFLGIPMHTLNFEKEYKKTVMDYFFKEYSAGRTPNPDVMCNKEIKFKLLYKWARQHGFDMMATGHYAQVQKKKLKKTTSLNLSSRQPQVPPSGTRASQDSFLDSRLRGNDMVKMNGDDIVNLRGNDIVNLRGNDISFELVRSADDFKDQTYFIYNISQSQLPHLVFPIGGLKKSVVKALAKKIKLPNMNKKESMGLCFVGQIRLKDFLEQKLKVKAGPIVNMQGKKIGEHAGLAFYTIGQRQGIRVGQNGPWFVVRKNLKKNELVVTNNPNDKALETKEIEIHSVNWITKPEFPSSKLKKSGSNSRKTVQNGVVLLGRFRHQGKLEKLTITELGRGHYKVVFDKPQKAIASGQSLVLYDGKICLGGGVIV